MNRFIIADPKKCIGCRTCEIACGMAHSEGQDISAWNATSFAPRLHVVKGV
ncbi:MAG: electron transport protein HydN, partial [Serratia liquefaciens]|nr:electron transport protein HydN [Serratia liquefaciens]